MYPCFLPHLKHLFNVLVENFGFFLALAIIDFLAIYFNIDNFFYIYFPKGFGNRKGSFCIKTQTFQSLRLKGENIIRNSIKKTRFSKSNTKKYYCILLNCILIFPICFSSFVISPFVSLPHIIRKISAEPNSLILLIVYKGKAFTTGINSIK